MLKREVLRRQKDFALIYKKGRSVSDRYVVMFYRPNKLTYDRVAFIASKKVGNSVARNRARRLMKESFRAMEDPGLSGYDVVFIARNAINNRKCADVKKSLESAVKKSGLCNRR